MPYTSDAQRRWAHTKTGTEALGGPSKVAEWDKASKGKNLPERAPKMAKGGSVRDFDADDPLRSIPMTKGKGPVSAHFAQGGEVQQTQPSRFAKERPIFRKDSATLNEVVQPQKSRFMDEPDPFRTDTENSQYPKKGKGGSMAVMQGDN